MKEIDPSSFGATAHEMLAPNLIRKLARHCYTLCYDDPEVAHSFLVPGADDPEQLETVYIDMASTDIPYDPDSLWHRTLEFLKLADYVRPPSYSVQFYPDPQQAANGKAAARTVTVDASNKFITGETNAGAPFSTDELKQYAGRILGIHPGQETENLTPTARMNRARTHRVLQAFANFTQNSPIDEVVEAYEVTSESATTILGIRHQDRSYGLMWHSPLARTSDTEPQAEGALPYMLRWRQYQGSKPGSILADRAGLTQPPDRTITQKDIDMLGLGKDEEKLVVPIAIHDAVIERFERILGESTPESLLITDQELSGLHAVAKEGLRLNLYLTSDSVLLSDSLFEQPNTNMVFESAGYLTILRLTPTSSRQEYVADYVVVPPDSREIQEAVRAIVRTRHFGCDMVSQEQMTITQARAFVRETLAPPDSVQ